MPILGAGLTIVADGSAPWEDRPLLVPGLGTLPGKRGEADPGDDTGPANRVVRSWDTIFYRVAVSVREAPADDVAVEVTLTGPAVWEPARVTALSLSGCPGGATLLDSQLPPAKAGGLRSD